MGNVEINEMKTQVQILVLEHVTQIFCCFDSNQNIVAILVLLKMPCNYWTIIIIIFFMVL
jgi:uncharacterized membrane protein